MIKENVRKNLGRETEKRGRLDDKDPSLIIFLGTFTVAFTSVPELLRHHEWLYHPPVLTSTILLENKIQFYGSK